LSLAIDAKEKRDVAIADVVGAYLLANMNDFVVIKVTGESTDVMCKVRPDYEELVVIDKGKRVLYLRLSKALYGCIQSALLWYNTFKEHLIDMGFKLNPYDPCVANAVIDGHQCTICWYVDDMKISHKKSKTVNRIIRQMEEKFGKMTITRGNKHTFVGIDIEFKRNGTVALSMEDYIKECVNTYGDEIPKVAPTPAKGNLFDEDVGGMAKLISDEEAEKFHHVTAKLLFASKRARIDADLAVA